MKQLQAAFNRGEYKLKRFLDFALTMVFVLVVGYWGARLGLILIIHEIDTWKYNADFEAYEDEFVLLREYVSRLPHDFDYLRVSRVKNGDEILYDLYHPEKKEKLNCPEHVKQALSSVCQGAYSAPSGLDVIYREADGTITFWGEGDPYALVYSPGGNPKSHYSKEMQRKARLRGIGWGWYHVSFV